MAPRLVSRVVPLVHRLQSITRAQNRRIEGQELQPNTVNERRETTPSIHRSTAFQHFSQDSRFHSHRDIARRANVLADVIPNPQG